MKNREYIDRLYESSRDLFRKKGYDAVTMDEICEKAGVSKPTAYAASLTKPNLLAGMYRPPGDALYDAANLPQDPIDAIERHLDFVLDRVFSFGPSLLRDLLRMEIEGHRSDYFIDRGWYLVLIDLIARARTARAIESDLDAEDLAGMVANFLIGYSFEYSISHADENRQNLYEGVGSILLARRYANAQ